MRILVLAYAISPTKGSEYSVAWNYVKEMSKQNQLVVLFGNCGNYIGDVDEILSYKKLTNVCFIPIRANRKVKLLNILSKYKFLTYTSYYAYNIWQKQTYNKAKELIENESFDLIHYVGPIGYREPGYLWKLDLPYMWGPIGGAPNVSLKFFPGLTYNGKLHFLLRFIVNTIQLHFNRRLKKALYATDLLLTATTENQELFLKIHNKDSIYLPENCIRFKSKLNTIKFMSVSKLNIIFIGTIENRKGVLILAHALKRIKNKNKIILHMVGNGPLISKMKLYFAKIGIDVIWYGQIPRSEVFELLNKSHLHILPSVSEANTTVLWEAMSHGVPTLSLDHCGMKDIICEKCGFKIPLSSYKNIIDNIAKTIDKCIAEPYLLEEKAKGTIYCSEKYYWTDRRKILTEYYTITVENYKKRKDSL